MVGDQPLDGGLSGEGAATSSVPNAHAATTKLVANSTLFGVFGVLGEALALAHGLGLSRETAFEVLAVTPVRSRRNGAGP
jgi:3-hydroxyisobutyrate dehydrogenase-like beta-hydroxyacid dehydrogenase